MTHVAEVLYAITMGAAACAVAFCPDGKLALTMLLAGFWLVLGSLLLGLVLLGSVLWQA